MSSSPLIQFDLGFSRPLIGVDEVGRGALAGPVVAVAVNFNFNEPELVTERWVLEVNDSKKLTASNRKRLTESLQKVCNYATASASVQEIDEYGILAATFLAMSRAINQVVQISALNSKELLILVDGNLPIKSLKLQQQTIVKGDSKSFHIAAASIMAKTHRDNLMRSLDQRYSSDFGWDSNVGYGTEKHRQAIIKHGPTKEHRQSFLKSLLQTETQLNLLK